MDSEQAQIGTSYCGPPPEPGGLWSSWNLDPVLIAALLLSLAWGLRHAEARTLFLAGWTGLVLAFVSPLCALTTALFSARAVHHLLLVGLAAPAFAAGLPLRRVPAAAGFAATGLALVIWHVPAAYSAAWNSAAVYWLMQAALFVPAWAFWSAVFLPGDRSAEALLVHALLVGALAGTMGLIGAVLAFSDRVLYPQHLAGSWAWGVEALADQQAAGLVMWVPGLVPLALVAALMLRRVWRLGAAA
ncbi:MAG: cytochrome c oxidase assembly protein [Paracoccus sp. BP8]|nr:MAG: cytochrome c oxidase assembly protein [Paracoccus sp. BP8]